MKITHIAQNASSDQFKNLANQLIQFAWNSGLLDDQQKYSDYQVSLVIDSDYNLSKFKEKEIWKIVQRGANEDEAIEALSEAIRQELIKREESIFKKREKKLQDDDKLEHLRTMIRGASWRKAKRVINEMTAAGKYMSNWRQLDITDEQAEESFVHLYTTIFAPGYVDIKALISISPYIRDGQRYLVRLSEMKFEPDAEPHRFDPDRARQYEFNEFMLHQGWIKDYHAVQKPPSQIEIYRGVSRADATLRPGDYVTTNRNYARSYIRGKYGKIIRETVNADDLLIMRVDDINMPEFVYYPRSFQAGNEASGEGVKPPMTFKQFYNATNGWLTVSGGAGGWYRKASSQLSSRSLKDIGFPVDSITIFDAVPYDSSVLLPLDIVSVNEGVAINRADYMARTTGRQYVVVRGMVRTDQVFESPTMHEYFYNGKTVNGEIVYPSPSA